MNASVIGRRCISRQIELRHDVEHVAQVWLDPTGAPKQKSNLLEFLSDSAVLGTIWPNVEEHQPQITVPQVHELGF